MNNVNLIKIHTKICLFSSVNSVKLFKFCEYSIVKEFTFVEQKSSHKYSVHEWSLTFQLCNIVHNFHGNDFNSI